jgi:stage II sporulation protein M
VLAVAVITVGASYTWVVINAPLNMDITPERAEDAQKYIADNLGNLDFISRSVPAPWLFFSNVRATILFMFAGLISFATLGVVLFMANMSLIGIVLGGASLINFSPLLVFASAVLPHGMFELTAVCLATAAVLHMGAQLVTPQTDKSLGDVFLLALADWFRVFIGLVVPLLAIASVIEVYVTPQVIRMAFPYL